MKHFPYSLFTVLTLISIGLLSGCSQESTDTPRKPNIIFILVDDLGKEWVSAYGAEDIETPHVDQLAATGMQFSNAYVMPSAHRQDSHS